MFKRKKAKGRSGYYLQLMGSEHRTRILPYSKRERAFLSQAVGREIPTGFMDEIKDHPFELKDWDGFPRGILVICVLEVFRSCPEVLALTIVLVL